MITMRKRKFALMMTAVFLLGAVCCCGALAGINYFAAHRELVPREELAGYRYYEETYRELDALKRQVKEQSLYRPEEEQLMLGMKKGLLAGVGDPYSTYLTREEYDSLMISATGMLQGIGVTINAADENRIEIVSTFKGSPARKAGLQSGDIILKVDGTAYDGASLEKAAAAMRGKPGTRVRITYSRGGTPAEVEIIRASIEMESVFVRMLDSGIGLIEISAFESNTGEDFKKALHQLESAGARGVIIDLRDNGGGVVESGVTVADQLLDEGMVAYTEDAAKNRKYLKSAAGKTRLPYVILINQGSASTSEIVAAGIRDNKGGLLVGTRTYGKGIIQKVEKISEQDAIRLTIMEYFSPRGVPIQEKGIMPDYTVEQPEGEPRDLAMEKAENLLKEKNGN